MQYQRDRELDACGIGFVADAQGRSSRLIVTAALAGLASVIHRGAVAADARSADGSGVLTPIPPRIYGDHGVAQLFVRGEVAGVQAAVTAAAAAEGITVTGWREPPVDDRALGEQALASKPVLLQAMLTAPAGCEPGGADAERAALRMRRRLDQANAAAYVSSCSFRTIVHKGLVAANRLGDFWLDLTDERFEAAFTVFHQRFSTNTLPTWERAQPFRTLCHNGEINAIAGNWNRMRARATLGTVAAGLGPEALFAPVLEEGGSDSAMLDNAVELVTRGGRDIRHAVAMLVPEAWEGVKDLDRSLRGFYRYHASLVEPWDGPAGLVFSDGLGVGASLDRNGLRPLRYAICEDGLVTCCSEAGAIDVSGHGTVTRGRLGPGEMLFVDPSRGVLIDHDCKQRLAAAGPYARWADDGLVRLTSGQPTLETPDQDALVRRQAVHGYTTEELRMVLKPMAADAKEPVFSMGDDAPLPHLAGRPRPIHHYLRQRFAQVTNPPIDHLRERPVMSLRTLLGPRSPLLAEGPDACRQAELPSFFLFPEGINALTVGEGSTAIVDTCFPAGSGAAGLRTAIARVAADVEREVAMGATVVALDDSAVSADLAPIPSLLALGATHSRLIKVGLRDHASIVVLADDVRDVHHVACLLGYGADAICPRLALATVASEADASEDSDVLSPEAQERYQAAVEDGVLKVMSKMGISTLDSYRGAQVFEAIGLGPEVIDLCFPGTPSTTGGVGFEALGEDVLTRHAAAELTNPGYYRDLKRGGEHHTHNKAVVDALQAATRSDDAAAALKQMAAAHHLQQAVSTGSTERYEAYATLVNSRPPTELRDLLELVSDEAPVPLGEVEPATSILQRFSTGAMSHGSLSREAHETLAMAMNLVGGKSNCGEGGEDPSRFATRGSSAEQGYDKNSKIKQIASGRFGVTPQYCANADELQIKVAQGSKPGEGGQLPGHKVSDEIAKLRHTQPGVTLISPPPHHDIYSIEDLAQLIYDLKQVNTFADVGVKLVAEAGVGTIAAGVVKALADVVMISGANGGTGASPLSSIKHAGLPWELGLADTQQALVENKLRDRVRVRVDGGFLTGRDVFIAALLGADEYSFGTGAMIAEGCIMLRACHKDTCSTGVATQRPHLRAKFAGTPEGVAAYFIFVAEEVRGLLASLGLRSLDDAIGRVDLLRQRPVGDPRADATDLSPLLVPPADPEAPRRYVAGVPLQRPRSSLGDQLVADAYRALWEGDDLRLTYPIGNGDRSIGAALGGALALEFGEARPPGNAFVHFDGSAGQSFGAFLTAGVTLELEGEANDYVGKAMGGGTAIVRPPADDASLAPGADPLRGHRPALAGNTCLYGATGGELFVSGIVGERFAIRNSGATAVVEGAGDHACEYMTGGTVVILGRLGYNLGAGMTGGSCYVWDPQGAMVGRVNTSLVDFERPDEAHGEELRALVARHAQLTGSPRAVRLLERWDETVHECWYVAPLDKVSRLRSQAAAVVGANV